MPASIKGEPPECLEYPIDRDVHSALAVSMVRLLTRNACWVGFTHMQWTTSTTIII